MEPNTLRCTGPQETRIEDDEGTNEWGEVSIPLSEIKVKSSWSERQRDGLFVKGVYRRTREESNVKKWTPRQVYNGEVIPETACRLYFIRCENTKRKEDETWSIVNWINYSIMYNWMRDKNNLTFVSTRPSKKEWELVGNGFYRTCLSSTNHRNLIYDLVILYFVVWLSRRIILLYERTYPIYRLWFTL